jgi:hypothetical protein
MKMALVLPMCLVCLWATMLLSVSHGAERSHHKEALKGEPVFAWNPVGQALTKTLVDLAKSQGLDPEDYRAYRSLGAMAPFSDGVLTSVTERGKTFAVAIQEADDSKWSGSSALQLVLLTTEGRILDRVRCGINGRYGVLSVEVLPKVDPDGARIVIRFVGRVFAGSPGLWHNWHDIGFQGKVWKFWTKESHTPNQWNERGLCRLQIANGKWRVVFPKLDLPDLRAARALDIGFLVGSERKSEAKHVSVNDPKQVRALLAAIDIPGREQGDGIGVWDRGLWDVTFIMPDGRKFAMAFVTSTLLCDSGHWGRIHLGSPGLYRTLRTLATRETRQPVRFLYDDAKPN